MHRYIDRTKCVVLSEELESKRHCPHLDSGIV